MKYYKKIEELSQLCKQRNEDDSITFEDICITCPKKELCDLFFSIFSLFGGESPCEWSLDTLESLHEEITKKLGEEND